MLYITICKLKAISMPPKGGDAMKLITLYLPEPYIKMLDQLVNEKYYPNRAEAIRVAIRDLINGEIERRKRVD
jgi:antitoxin ParD1/3/4